MKPSFKGYQFDGGRHPTFFYRIGNLEVSDHCTPMVGETGFVRTLDFENEDSAPENLYFSLYQGAGIVGMEDGKFMLGNNLAII